MSTRADVCLVLEGTFPYVSGGVSTWVHHLLLAFPHLHFALVFLGGQRGQTPPRAYDIPDNVVSYSEHFLFEPPRETDLRGGALSDADAERLERELRRILDPEAAGSTRLAAAFDFAAWLAIPGNPVRLGHFLHGPEGWEAVVDIYKKRLEDFSFIDFYWACRFMAQPLWTLLRALPQMPPAAVYHSVSTGYAGALAALAARHHSRPLLLTEHGIYTKERIIEITQADWIHETPTDNLIADDARFALKNQWIGLFRFLGEMTYAASREIVTLFSGNARLQEEFGADPSRIRIIPNGIDAAAFSAARAARRDTGSFHVGFVGRIVPIKDIKTLLRAARLLLEDIPSASLTLYGPATEDPEYFAECIEMAENLGITEKVRFAGPAPVTRIMPGIDALVLTSVSESFPLVILEAFASRVPVVATDVGGCRELVAGCDAEDRAMGPGGLITGIASPSETALALAQLARDPGLRARMGETGLRRVTTRYSSREIWKKYGALYAQLAATGDEKWPV